MGFDKCQVRRAKDKRVPALKEPAVITKPLKNFRKEGRKEGPGRWEGSWRGRNENERLGTTRGTLKAGSGRLRDPQYPKPFYDPENMKK